MSSALLIAAVSLAAAVKVATPVAPAPASPHPRVSIAAIPAWVDVIALDLEATGPTSAEGGHFTELSDHQTHVDPGDHQVVRFHREVERVVTASGIDAAARVELMFDPEYQRLELVHLQVVRGKQAIDVLRLGELKVLQRESDLERQVYDGRLSVIAFVPDVRVGDRVDVAYSVRGDNPVLAGHFEDNVDLSPRRPISRLRERFLVPLARHVEVRTHQDAPAPSVTDRGDLREYLWDLVRDSDGDGDVDDDDDHVSGTPRGAWAQLGEFASWDEVVHWALPMYQAVAGGGVLAKVAEWRKLPTRPAQVAAAVRFVQDEVRYLGFEMGPGSHQPRPPEQTLERRFGDCKDKSLLLATALRELGVPAAPALVDPDWGARLDGLRPSPYAFDHVIVRAELDGQVLWIDPTMTYQRGPLAQLTPPYQRALVVDAEQHALVTIPPPPPDASPDLEIRESYLQPGTAPTITLEVQTTRRRDEANAMRAELAASDLDTLAQRWRKERARTESHLTLLGAIQIADDEQANVLVTTERYQISDFWKDGDHSFSASGIAEVLDNFSPGRRRPLPIEHPRNIIHDIAVQLPTHGPWKKLTTQSQSFVGPAFRLDAEIRYQRATRTLRHHFHYQSTSDEVPTADLDKHRIALEQAKSVLYHGAHEMLPGSAGSDDGSDVDGDDNAAGIRLYVLFGVLALVGFGMVVLTRRGRRQRAVATADTQPDHGGRRGAPRGLEPGGFAPGESPGTALALSVQPDPAALVRETRCSCGAPLDARTPPEVSTLSLGGRELSVVRAPCIACDRRAAIYFYLR